MEVKGILHGLSAVETLIVEDVAALNEMLRTLGKLLMTDGAWGPRGADAR